MTEKSVPPEWVGKALMAARHQDQIASWPWYGRLLHKWFAPHCPACAEWRKP